MLEVNGCLKMTEQDDYQEGCLPETGDSVWIDCHWKADTKDDIIRQLMEFVGVNEGDDAVELDAYGEQGRIDISQTENADGNDPSPTQYDLWKKGQEKLWYCTYSFKVEEVQRTAFAMAKTQETVNESLDQWKVKRMTDAELLRDYEQCMKDRFHNLFGRNAREYQSLVASELLGRGIKSFPGLFGPIQIEN
jgi:hypothetical protein